MHLLKKEMSIKKKKKEEEEEIGRHFLGGVWGWMGRLHQECVHRKMTT